MIFLAKPRLCAMLAGGKRLFQYATVMLFMTLGSVVYAQTQKGGIAGAVTEGSTLERSISEWLIRIHEASRRRAYVGTFVVSAGGSLSSSRIWHVCDGEQQMERVESLTGTPRATFRRNDQVITFLPESHVAVNEKRESLSLFPNLLQTKDTSIAQFYRVKGAGHERVAGFDADVIQLLPRDNWRFGYRVWAEKKTGLVVKLQTLEGNDQVLEQASFSELQLDAPVSMNRLELMMGNTEGYQIIKPELVKTTAAAQGWVLKSAVPGFKTMNCYKRPVVGGAESQQEATMQWIFSDGLASVSIFIETFNAKQHGQPGQASQGATSILKRHMGDWWLTVVGEVPPHTLVAFAQGLERTK